MEITVLNSCFAQFLAAEDLLMQPYATLFPFGQVCVEEIAITGLRS